MGGGRADLDVRGGSQRQAAAVRGDSLLHRMIGNTCPAERRIHYSQPRVLGQHGSQEGDWWGGRVVGRAREGLRAPSWSVPTVCTLTSFAERASTLAEFLLDTLKKNLFIMRTSRHIHKEREQCNVHPCPNAQLRK